MKLLVVIPVRGQSKGIPRKNVRLMNGIPLMVYSMRTADLLKEKYDSDVVITTEDEEIKEVAGQYGMEVVERPEELAGDAVTLDPVIYHAVTASEASKNKTYDIVITMQATSPTLRAVTLQNAVESFISGVADTMISAVNEPHLSWGYDGDELTPNYEKRVNRQQLPKHFKETGGFLITRRECITETGRIGKKVTVYEVPKNEAIDIDNDHDWKVCEAILSAKRILFRADGEEKLGMGHIYRCLSLAYHLTGHELLFVTKKDYPLGVKKLQDSYFKLRIIEKDEELYSILDEFKPDILVNDILNVSVEYMKEVKSRVPRVINFEDRGNGAALADCVINALYTNGKGTNIYQGSDYFFIRDEFLTAKPKEFSREVKNVVVLFGGSDPSNLTGKTYKILQQMAEKHQEIEFHIITGFGYKYKNEIQDDVAHKIYIHNDVKRVSKYLAEADLAITSQGRTIFELACMGVPAVVLAQNSRELSHVFASFSNGFINLGLGSQQQDETIHSTIEWLINTPSVRKEMRELLLDKDFKQGQKNVLELILGGT